MLDSGCCLSRTEHCADIGREEMTAANKQKHESGTASSGSSQGSLWCID